MPKEASWARAELGAAKGGREFQAQKPMVVSAHAELQQVVNVDDADRFAVFDDEQNGDGQAVHDFHGRRRKQIRCNGLGVRGHDFTGWPLQQIRLHVTAKIAVRYDPGKTASAVDDAEAAKTFGGHRQKSF